MTLMIIIILIYLVLKNFSPCQPTLIQTTLRQTTPRQTRNGKTGLPKLRQKGAVWTYHLDYEKVKCHWKIYVSLWLIFLGDYFETFNGSHWSGHTTPTPSTPGSCSNSVEDGHFEEFPRSTTSPTRDLLCLDAHEEMIGSSFGYTNSVTPVSDQSAQQSILADSHVDLLFHRGDNIYDPAMLRDTCSQASFAVTIPDFELESHTDQLSTANLWFGTNRTRDLEAHSSSNRTTSSVSTTLSQTSHPDNIAQQQGSKSGLCNLQVDTFTDSEEGHFLIGQANSKGVWS